MEQMNVPEGQKIELDFEDRKLSDAVRSLRPLVYREGDTYCCVLGPDTANAIFGSAPTLAEALTEWETSLRKRIIYHAAGDEVIRFVEDNLNARKEDIN